MRSVVLVLAFCVALTGQAAEAFGFSALAQHGRVGYGLPARRLAVRRQQCACAIASADPLPSGGRKRVAVVGSGAVGLYYGARLLEAGHDVSFVARSDLQVLQERGLTVESVDGDMRFAEISVVGKPEDIGEVDWVVMALKTYALPAVRVLRRQFRSFL